jgi:hypothetical protein
MRSTSASYARAADDPSGARPALRMAGGPFAIGGSSTTSLPTNYARFHGCSTLLVAACLTAESGSDLLERRRAIVV